MRVFVFSGVMLALAACNTPVPDSGRRDVQLEGGIRVPQAILPPEEQIIAQPREGATPLPAPVPGSEAERLAADTRAALGAPPIDAFGTTASVGAPAPLPGPAQGPSTARRPADATNPGGISSENDFQAVSADRSIEEDAERLRQLRAQGGVQQVNPNQVVLERPSNAGPNVVQYALRQARPVGNPGWSRGAFASQRSAERKCQAYRNADAAQAAFLERGGPDVDRLGLDPDGDGNACGWDPAAYRSIVRSGN